MTNPFHMKATGGADESPAFSGCSPGRANSGVRRLTVGTAQQDALWAELASDSTAHVVVEARAGSGKSSSCREAMWRMLERSPGLAGSIRYAVFNSQNAREFRDNCPSGVDVGTVHSFGNAALAKTFASKVERNKTYLILDETREGKTMPRYLRRSISLLVGHAKNQALVPDMIDLDRRLRQLMLHFDVNVYGRAGWLIDWAKTVLSRSAEWTELIDFDDMIWLPGLHRLDFPHIDVLFLDEVQDWNPAQHALIELLCPAGRIVAVGDRYQAIYAWRGADPDSIPRLEEQLRRSGPTLSLPLTITWRCPKSHVELARTFVADIEAAPAARDGIVDHQSQEQSLGEAAPGDMVLCATNAPLVRAALRLIASRRRAVVRGRAIGDQLAAVVRGCPDARTIADLSRHVQAWSARELLRLSDQDGAEDLIESVQDRAAGLAAVLSVCDSPAQVEPTIASLFDDAAGLAGSPGAVVFSTIHRAKGLEADTVRLLDAPQRAPRADWEVQQARNLRYVALTRSKQRLVFVSIPKE